MFKHLDCIDRFIDLLVSEGLTPEEVDEEGIVEVCNPPYSTLEYVAPFVNQLRDALVASGFSRASSDEVYVFINGQIEAEIRNVEADRETGPAIDVRFRFLGPREMPTVPQLPEDEDMEN